MVALTIAAAMLAAGPEERAVAYLDREVPRWSAEHRCYSCHHNGDAARALYAARRAGLEVPAEALADTSRWLARPDRWDHNGGDGPFSDKRLARIQFAAALEAGLAAGALKDRKALVSAAEALAGEQDADGSWRLDEAGSVGSPATYGRALATYLARETLRSADPKLFSGAIGRADRWLIGLEPRDLVEAAAVLLAAGRSGDPRWATPRRRALDPIRKARSEDGGWGPTVNAPPEAFDSALVMLVLRSQEKLSYIDNMILGSRKYLVRTQLDDGSWPETTRPGGGESYAQRLSTAAWATLALIATRPDG